VIDVRHAAGTFFINPPRIDGNILSIWPIVSLIPAVVKADWLARSVQQVRKILVVL
jgi:hypothetical protein